jgi:hypothetical protein
LHAAASDPPLRLAEAMLGVSVNPMEEVEGQDEEAEAGARLSEWDGERIIVYMARDGQLHAIQVGKLIPLDINVMRSGTFANSLPQCTVFGIWPKRAEMFSTVVFSLNCRCVFDCILCFPLRCLLFYPPPNTRYTQINPHMNLQTTHLPRHHFFASMSKSLPPKP